MQIAKLTAEPIKHAFALIEDPDHPGVYFGVHLKEVYAETIEFLEPSARNEKATFAMQRIDRAMSGLHRKKEWNK